MDNIFHYTLPEEYIAQYPRKNRQSSKLMVISRKIERIEETVFSNLGTLLKKGDVLVLNDAKVIPARIMGNKETGGKLEIFLLERKQPGLWEVLLRGKTKPGSNFIVGDIHGKVVEKMESGTYIISIDPEREEELKSCGQVPLPPYIKRMPVEEDKTYYQTVYAEKAGAVAAPTAGLHFTLELLEQLERQGVIIVRLTLYIGWASFKIIKEPDSCSIPEERFEISPDTARVINKAKETNNRIVAVGTSCVRALESSVQDGKVIPQSIRTDLFIKPGFDFRVVDILITNLHLPGSTHLFLVCAFAGNKLTETAYTEAVNKNFKFYSYGDSMIII